MSTQTTTTEGVIETSSLFEATETATEIFRQLAVKRVRVSLDHQPQKMQFKLYGVSHADMIKTVCADFEIKEDTYKRRYAELYVKYE